MVCLWIPEGPPVLGLRAEEKPLLEGFVQVGAVVSEDGADCMCPVAPVSHYYRALIGPVVPCGAVGMIQPFVCVRAESLSACVSDVGECGDLEKLPAPVHLFVEFMIVWEVGD